MSTARHTADHRTQSEPQRRGLRSGAGRRAECWIAGLFVYATFAFALGNALIDDGVVGFDRTGDIEAQHWLLVLGSVLELSVGAAVAVLAILLATLLRCTAPGLAVTYLGLRLAQLLLIVAHLVLALLPLPMKGQESGELTVVDSVATRDLLLIAIYALTALAGIVLCLALRSGDAAPRWLTTVGLAAYALMAGSALMAVAGGVEIRSAAGLALIAPAGIFEFVLPAWLVLRGLSLPAGHAPPVPVGIRRVPAPVALHRTVAVAKQDDPMDPRDETEADPGTAPEAGPHLTGSSRASSRSSSD